MSPTERNDQRFADLEDLIEHITVDARPSG